MKVPRHTRTVPAALAALALFPISSRALGDEIYEATFTGTITDVDFQGIDPGPFAGLAPGDTYSLAFEVGTTGLALNPTFYEYQVGTSELRFDSGALTGNVIPSSQAGVAYVATAPTVALYSFAVEDTVAGGRFGFGVRLDDFLAPAARDDTSLPIGLDLAELSGTFWVGVAARGSGLVAGSVDSFSARIVPGPGVAGLIALAGLGVGRRRH